MADVQEPITEDTTQQTSHENTQLRKNTPADRHSSPLGLTREEFRSLLTYGKKDDTNL